MTTTHPSPLVAGPYATYDSPTISIKWAAAMEDFKTPPTDSDRAGSYEMEVVTEKSKIMTNSMKSISAGNSMNGQKLEEVTSFKYLGETLCKDGTCSAEIRIRLTERRQQWPD